MVNWQQLKWKQLSGESDDFFFKSMLYAIIICEMNAKLDEWDKRDAIWMSRATQGVQILWYIGILKIDSTKMSQNRMRNDCSGMNVEVVLNELRSREFV